MGRRLIQPRVRVFNTRVTDVVLVVAKRLTPAV